MIVNVRSAGLVMGVLLACAGNARAGGDDAPKSEGEAKAPAATGEAEPRRAGATENAGEEERGGEGKEPHEEEEGPFAVSLDFVVGSARTDAVTQTTPGAAPGGSATAIDSARVTTYSFLLGGAIELHRGFEIGVRVPLQGGEIFDPAYRRGTASIGNIEVEPELSIPLTERLELGFAFGVALPTAQGTPTPDSVDDVHLVANGIDQSSYDRATIQRAVAMARGYDENALYEPKHLGLIPKVRLRWFAPEKWHVDPWVKVENLIATTSEESFVSELVFGVNAGYFLSKAVEPALRVWGNIPLTGADFTAVAVVEPELKVHIGEGTLLAGAILPFAGPLTSPYAIGVRIGGGARF